MVGIESADSGNSMIAVATMLVDYGVPAIPVVQDGIYCGLVFEEDIFTALQSGKPEFSPASEIQQSIPAISNRASKSETLRQMESHAVSTLAVTDDRGHVLGVITASRLLALNDRYARPKLVGGLATPFGVRLLGGGVIAGAGPMHILATGAMMFLTFIIGTYLSMFLALAVPFEVQITDWFQAIQGFLSLVFFLLLLRAQPLAGYHAAEHMVVHAIEQNEPLEPETVARMPRVHPRCGTNIAVAAGLFLGISQTPLIPWADIRMLLALLATLFLYRPLGSFVQDKFTTKPPSPKQLEAGIAAGKELLSKYQTAGNITPTIPMRIWQSGMLHAVAGSMGMAIIVMSILSVLPIPDYWKVIL
jgi:CBS domain-containing protein